MGMNEPKRRVKYSIDPNALNWANDETKFGKRLMERFGWKEGKGLGAKESGMTENIKIKFKDNTKGVGYDNNDYDNVWLDHQNHFDDLLSQLKQENNESTEQPVDLVPNDTDGTTAGVDANGTTTSDQLKSLEEKSKNSKARVHYRKFTRSKDLTNASEMDLDCILGRQKRIKLKQQVEVNSDSSNSSTSDENSNMNNERPPIESITEPQSTFQTYTNSQSINDYFAKKMAEIKKRREEAATGSTESKDEATIATSVENDEGENGEVKKKKKKKKEREEEANEQDLNGTNGNGFVEEQLEITVECVTEEVETNKKRKKKKKHAKEEESAEQEEMTTTIEEQKVEDEEPIEPEKKKKKKKRKAESELTIEEEETTVTIKTTTTTNGSQMMISDDELDGLKRFNRNINEDTESKEERYKRHGYDNPFDGSNIYSLSGYKPYIVTRDINMIINEKEKRLNKKQKEFNKIIQNDPNTYHLSKKPAIKSSTNE